MSRPPTRKVQSSRQCESPCGHLVAVGAVAQLGMVSVEGFNWVWWDHVMTLYVFLGQLAAVSSHCSRTMQGLPTSPGCGECGGAARIG